jgi:hypothetical protein
MEGVELTNPMFWVSIILGGIILAAISYGFQMAQEEDETTPKQFNVKGVIRDFLLGGIFTTMAWTFLPDVMNSFTTSISSATVSSTSSSVKSGGGDGTGDVVLQVGPARF